MEQLPTIVVIGYDVHPSWLDIVKQALTESDPKANLPEKGPVIRIPGGLHGVEFVVTLKPQTSAPNDKIFTVKPDPHGPDGITLLLPNEPIDQLRQRTGWFRKEILEAIVKAITTAFANAIETVKDTRIDQPIKIIDPRWTNVPVNLLTPAQADFQIYFDPDLSPEQIEKSFAALADYYRACGGTGLRVEFEEQDVRVPELAYDGR